MISFKLHVVFQEGKMADGIESIAEKIHNRLALFICKKKIRNDQYLQSERVFPYGLKKILNMFLFCKLFKIYVVVKNIDTLNEKKFLNDSYARTSLQVVSASTCIRQLVNLSPRTLRDKIKKNKSWCQIGNKIRTLSFFV